MKRIRNYIHSSLTLEKLNEFTDKYKFAREILRETGINSSDLKRAYEHYKIPYPFGHKKGQSYKPKSSVDEDFFSRRDERSFYWAGFWAADGYIRENKKKNGSITYFVSCGLATADKDHLELFKTHTNYTGNIKDYIIIPSKLLLKSKNCVEIFYASKIDVVSQKLFNDIQNFGLTPAKTYDYTMPEWLIDHPFLNHFIRGYIDGDGSIEEHHYPHIDSLRLSLVGACPAVKQIWNIFHNKCNLRSGGFISEIENEYGTKMSRFEFNSIYDFRQITNYLYNDATVFLQRKCDPISKINEIMDKCRNYFLDEKIIQKRYDELGSFLAVAKELNCDPGVVARTLQKYGTRVNTQEEINDNKRQFSFDPEKLRKDYEQHQSSTKLSEIYNCSMYTILFYLKKFGIEHNKQGSNLIRKYFIEFDKNKLQKEYNNLRTINKLAELYECDVATIRKAFKNFEIKAHPRTGPAIKYHFEINTLQQQYNELKSLTAVAKVYGCDKNIIANAMNKFGIPYEKCKNQFNS